MLWGLINNVSEKFSINREVGVTGNRFPYVHYLFTKLDCIEATVICPFNKSTASLPVFCLMSNIKFFARSQWQQCWQCRCCWNHNISIFLKLKNRQAKITIAFFLGKNQYSKKNVNLHRSKACHWIITHKKNKIYVNSIIFWDISALINKFCFQGIALGINTCWTLISVMYQIQNIFCTMDN